MPEQEFKSAPSLGARLAWWFGIYFGAQLPLIQNIAFFYMFPFGLGCILLGKAPPPFTPDRDLFLMPYAIYLVHLVASIRVRTKRVFRILLIALVAIVALNLVGCESLLTDLSKHHD